MIATVELYINELRVSNLNRQTKCIVFSSTHKTQFSRTLLSTRDFNAIDRMLASLLRIVSNEILSRLYEQSFVESEVLRNDNAS